MKITINFASREYLLARKIYMALALALCAGALVFAVNYSQYKRAIGRSSALASQLGLQQRRDADVQKRLAAIRKAVNEAEVKSAAQQAEFANMAIRRRTFSWTAFLNRIEEVVPDGVSITGVRPNFETLDMDISGKARSMAHATEFVYRLTKSGYFEDIPPVFHTTEELADKDTGLTLHTFNLKIRYNPEGSGDKAPLAKEEKEGR